MLRKRIARIILTIYCLSLASPAMAGGGGATGGSTEPTQLMNNAELVAEVQKSAEQITNQITQITNQITQITNQIEQIQNMIFNTLELPMQIYSQVTGIYNRIKGVFDKAKGIAYTIQNFDEELKRRLKGYNDLSFSSAQDFAKETRAIVDTQMETVRSTLKAINVAWDQFEKDDTKTLEQLQKAAQTAKGRNSIAQAGNQLLGFLGEELMKLRQISMMQAQMAGVAMEAERAEQDAVRKFRQEMVKDMKDPFDPESIKKHYKGSILDDWN